MASLSKPKKQIVRDQNELVGALLPPPLEPIAANDPLRMAFLESSASPVVDAASSLPEPSPAPFAIATASSSTVCGDIPIASAVSVEPFRNAAESEESDVIQTAPFLPTYHDIATPPREYLESAQIIQGSASGKARSREELNDIEKNRREIYAKTWSEKEAIKAANANAKQRITLGDEVEEDICLKGHTISYGGSYKKEDLDSTKYAGEKGSGYEICEYKTTEYETSEYETTEYKSVYDK